MDCKTVNFSGGGEPLVHTDFGTILRFAVRQGMKTWIVTNGYFIDKWMYDLAYAHHVRVSLDASTPEEHEQMHGKPDEFDRVLGNIATLCYRRKVQSAKPEVGIAFIVADCNCKTESFQRIFEFATKVGVDFIHFRPLSEEKPQRFTGDWPAIAQVIENLASDYPKVQCFPLGKRWKDIFTQRDFQKCYAAMVTSVIGANGDVVACCDERRQGVRKRQRTELQEHLVRCATLPDGSRDRAAVVRKVFDVRDEQGHREPRDRK